MSKPFAPLPDRLGVPLANASFAVMNRAIGRMRWLGIDILHMARSFAVYRRMFYRNRPASRVLGSLQGRRVVDVACGYTAHAPDSMFQARHATGIEFYGVDPVLSEPLVPGMADRILARWTGGSGAFLDDPPGGAVHLFPLPQCCRLELRHPDLRNALSAFTISQHFVLGNQRARTMSAMLTRLVKH